MKCAEQCFNSEDRGKEIVPEVGVKRWRNEFDNMRNGNVKQAH